MEGKTSRQSGKIDATPMHLDSAFEQFDCLAQPGQWSDLKSFAVIETERRING
ncbi:MAG: hypothetical protein ACK4Q4_09605 [Rhodocyclaceae bacterium]